MSVVQDHRISSSKERLKEALDSLDSQVSKTERDVLVQISRQRERILRRQEASHAQRALRESKKRNQAPLLQRFASHYIDENPSALAVRNGVLKHPITTGLLLGAGFVLWPRKFMKTAFFVLPLISRFIRR